MKEVEHFKFWEMYYLNTHFKEYLIAFTGVKKRFICTFWFPTEEIRVSKAQQICPWNFGLTTTDLARTA
jgi:hypothetical protein